MKKRQSSSKSINRNAINVFDHIRSNQSRNNLVTPEIHVNQIWMQDEDPNGVQIIELNSSSDSSKESPVNRFSHAWSYVNNDRFGDSEDIYKINEEARQNRRVRNHQNNFTTAYENEYYFDHNVQRSINGFYGTYDYDAEIDSASMNHQMNCFTIINKQNVNSNSSSENENYDAIEIIEVDDENNHWDHVYNKEVSTSPNTQAEKRTIFIYSFKNKRLLSDNDFELVNIPCDETSNTSSYSTSDEEQKLEKCTNTSRTGSPVPATYIPRLDLSLAQTLSTVTEVSEPIKHHSKEFLQETANMKPKNNWFTERNDKIKKETSIINWMALSPRERRRRSINTNSDIVVQENNKTEITYAEGFTESDQDSKKTSKQVSSMVQVEVDIHVNEKESPDHIATESIEESDAIPKKAADILPIKILFPDADSHIDNESKNHELDYSSKPHIQLSSKLDKSEIEITGPIEKLDSNNWISEELEEQQTAVFDYNIQNTADLDNKNVSNENIENPASNRLWIRSLQLMKEPKWAEYLPITGSPPSLHLSISCSSIEGKKSWYKRLTKCFKWCK